MRTCRQTGALLRAGGRVRPADEEPAVADLLEMAFQAQVRVAFSQHLGVDGAVGGMADGAAFTHGLVFEPVGAALSRMAPDAAFILRDERSASTEENRTFMRRMAIGAAHLSFRHRMMAGQVELAANVRVGLKAERFNRAGRPC